MTIFIKKVLLVTCTGISFVDSTPLRVCRNQRILIHKTFEGLAERGKYSMRWFFGFKLHQIINDKGEILNFMFTPGNVDDREPLKQGKFVENIKGKLCAPYALIFFPSVCKFFQLARRIFFAVLRSAGIQ